MIVLLLATFLAKSQMVTPQEVEAGRIDVLFANAGGGGMLPLGQITQGHIEGIFDRNVTSVIFTVLTGSSASIEGAAAFSFYSASEANARNLARSWVLDLKEAGIRVNVVSPGPIRTPFLLDLAGDDPAQQQGMLDYLGTRIPLGRVGEPEEIAKVALFLASDDPSFVNGAEIFADGGQAQV